MNKNLFFLVVLSTLYWLMYSPVLMAQESMNLLKKLDPGLPPSGLNGSNLGKIISYLGDVNNDGYDDWAVGLPYAADYETGAVNGKVYVYFGSSSIQNNKKPDMVLSGDIGTSDFGKNVVGAGDINNDGFSDILINENQKIFLYYGGNTVDTIPAGFFTKEAESGFFKTEISCAGDVNGDGFDDVLIGTEKLTSIFFGSINMNYDADIILKGDQEGDICAFSVSKAGDMNKDGFDDVIVIGMSYSSARRDVGRIYIYFGGPDLDNVADIVMTAQPEKDYFVQLVSDCGDINNDGFGDILVGGYHKVNQDVSPGRVYIYYGGTTIDTIPDIILNGSTGQSAGDINQDGFNDLLINLSVYWGGSSIDSIPDFVFTRASSIAGTGDYNNDGYTDVLTGNPGDNYNGISAGSVSIFYGGSQLHSAPDVVFYGTAGLDNYGSSISTAGDLNNDGYQDIIIGSPSNDQVAKDAGCTYIYFGSPTINDEPGLTLLSQNPEGKSGESVSVAGDVNSDGFSDIIVGSSSNGMVNLYLGNNIMDNIADFTFKAENSSSSFGFNVSNAGDFNNDGFDDIIIGDYSNSVNGTLSGRAFLYFGGLPMDTNPDLIFNGEAMYYMFGIKVAFAGDLNNDGYSDIMIGAPGYDRNDLLGRIYCYYGGSVPDTEPDLIITGNIHYQRIGFCISTAGDVNNDGFDDIIAGMPYYGNSTIGKSFVKIYFGGADMDTVPDIIFEKMVIGFGVSVSNAGDLNYDGFDDIMIGGTGNVNIYYGGIPMDTIPDIIIESEENISGEFGNILSFAGDINRDGYSDILIGAAYSSAVGYEMGRAYIYSSKIKNTGLKIAKDFSSNVIYPNPFYSETTIKYNLEKSGKIVVKIYNSQGQELETLQNGSQTSGEHQITWKPKLLPNGIYFCKIQSYEFSETKKIILQK